jgi:hypothetical protein
MTLVDELIEYLQNREYEDELNVLTALAEKEEAKYIEQAQKIEALENGLRVRNNLLDKYRKELGKTVSVINTQGTWG